MYEEKRTQGLPRDTGDVRHHEEWGVQNITAGTREWSIGWREKHF